MPIRRRRTPPPGLRHVPFLEMMAAAPADDPAHRGALATFLTLRLVDDWASGEAPAPDSRARAAAREAIAAVEDPDLRAALAAVLQVILALPEPDAQLVLAPVHALGVLLERRGGADQAVDVHRLVARLADPVVQPALAFESRMHAGRCLEAMGEPGWADQAYAEAGQVAAREPNAGRAHAAREARQRLAQAVPR